VRSGKKKAFQFHSWCFHWPLAVAGTTPSSSNRPKKIAKSILPAYSLARLCQLTNGFHFTWRLAADKLPTSCSPQIKWKYYIGRPGFDFAARDQIIPLSRCNFPTSTSHVLEKPLDPTLRLVFWQFWLTLPCLTGNYNFMLGLRARAPHLYQNHLPCFIGMSYTLCTCMYKLC